MRICVMAMFRNSTGYIPRYFTLVRMLNDALHLRGDEVRLLFAEGDSGDNTWDALHESCRVLGLPHEIIKREHGKRWAGNPDTPERWEALAFVANGMMERVREDDDAVIYFESDLIWTVPTALKMLDHLRTVPSVSPLVFTAFGAMYDVFGHRRAGIRFAPFPPYHPDLAPDGLGKRQLIEMDCTGSGWVLRGEVAGVARFGGEIPHSCGFGASIWKHGYSLWLDPTLSIIHP